MALVMVASDCTAFSLCFLEFVFRLLFRVYYNWNYFIGFIHVLGRCLMHLSDAPQTLTTKPAVQTFINPY